MEKRVPEPLIPLRRRWIRRPVRVGEVAPLAHELGDHAVEDGPLVGERLAADRAYALRTRKGKARRRVMR